MSDISIIFDTTQFSTPFKLLFESLNISEPIVTFSKSGILFDSVGNEPLNPLN